MASDDSKAVNDWQKLAEETSKETDPVRLARLVRELCAAIDEKEKGTTGRSDREDLERPLNRAPHGEPKLPKDA